MMKKKILVIGLLVAMFTPRVIIAQDKGDEDKTMANQAKSRDKKAIEDAMNGWWKASMKNHDA